MREGDVPDEQHTTTTSEIATWPDPDIEFRHNLREIAPGVWQTESGGVIYIVGIDTAVAPGTKGWSDGKR